MIGRSGGPPVPTRPVDPWLHFVNVTCSIVTAIASTGNPQDIFTPLYDKQIPPGAGQVVHFTLAAEGRDRPGRTDVKLRYRKFDYKYMELVHKEAGTIRSCPSSTSARPGDVAGRGMAEMFHRKSRRSASRGNDGTTTASAA